MKAMSQNIQKFLENDLLRLVIIGSVDDGKSTLIGRLLYETKGLFEDQIQAVKEYSSTKREHEIDYSLFTDGLKAEREQGITIDVAYRYFSTPKRRFIIADTPGHEQYTRNMATGASTASLSVILVDAERGVSTQTKRHSFISSLLGIRHFVVVVNKMDLVGYDEERYEEIIRDYMNFSEKLKVDVVKFIPASALEGENVIAKGTRMPWYKGSSLLQYIENVHIPAERNLIDFRFPVQYVNWSGSGSGSRGYCGPVVSGIIREGEEVTVIPSMKKTRVKQILDAGKPVLFAFAPQAVTLYLTDELDISRGDVIAREMNRPPIVRQIEADLVWFDEKALVPKKEYLFKHTTRMVRGSIQTIKYLFDPNDLHRHPGETLRLNQIGKVRIALLSPIYADLYDSNRQTGCFIVIDPLTNQTAAAGMITKCIEICPHGEERIANPVSGTTYWYIGRDRTRNGGERACELQDMSVPFVRLSDETVREGPCSDLVLPAGQQEFVLRIAGMCRIINDSGVDVIVLSEFEPSDPVKDRIGRERLITG